MLMAAKGLAKLIEECGELVQVSGKKLAYFSTDYHPDNVGSLKERLWKESADVIAAITLVAEEFGFANDPRFLERVSMKYQTFKLWNLDTNNNEFGVDSKTRKIEGTHNDNEG